MPTKYGLTIFLVPHNRKDSVSLRLKGWQVIASAIVFGVAVILFIIGVALGGRSTKLVAENRALRADNEVLRQQRVKIVKLERELEATSKLRQWMTQMVSIGESKGGEFVVAGGESRTTASLFDAPFKSRLFPEHDEASEAIRRRRDFVPRGLPVKGALTAHFGEMDGRFLKPHSGVDVAAPRGTPVLATAAGVVAEVVSDPILGNAVEIDHLNGFVTRYAHLEAITVKRGDWIERGDKIGTVGSSGQAEGAHVHYILMNDGVPINPIESEEKADQEG